MNVEFANLYKSFGAEPVLRGATWQIKAGQVATILGANGAGKSTLLGILATAIRPDQGRFTVGGFDRPELIRRHLGLISHAPLLTPELSVRENFDLWGRLHGLRRAEIGEAMTRWVHRLTLGGWLDRPIKYLSRGQAQRAAIATALLPDPPVVLLDEPFTGLDVGAAETLRELVHEWRRDGRTVILVTHDLPDGLALADRVAVLVNGKVFEPPSELRHDVRALAAAISHLPSAADR